MNYTKARLQTMNYAQARLRIWNPDAYDAGAVKDAAMCILALMDAAQEDIDQACLLLGLRPHRKKKNKIKYECDVCGQRAWAKPDANLVCGDCMEPMGAVN